MSFPNDAVAFQIVKHEKAFDPNESCLICGEADTVEPVLQQGANGFLGPYHVEVILSGLSVRPIADKELVHLSCHPDQAYHHKCLKQWVAHKALCPLDRRQLNPRSPQIQNPSVNNLNGLDTAVHNIAMSIFKKRY